MKIRVVTHSGEDKTVELETYDPVTLAEDINDNSIQVIPLGDTVFSRIDIKLTEPIEE